MTLVRVTRNYPFKGIVYPVGSEIDVPERTATRMVESSPPFGEIITDEELEQLTQPTPEPDTAPGATRLTFTAGAAALLAEAGVEQEDYAGLSVAGKVLKREARDWLEEEGRS